MQVGLPKTPRKTLECEAWNMVIEKKADLPKVMHRVLSAQGVKE